jgi:copper(I)-binding protein
MNVRRLLLAWLGLVLGTMGSASAHDFKAGDLRIDHPYATPSRPGVTTGAVYFRGIRNTVPTGDRLLSASTPVAARVEIHRMQMQGDVMRMRAVPALDIPGHSTVPLRHNTPDGHHLMLFDIKAQFKDGDRFPVTLTFERAGTYEVKVWVQTPRSGGSGHQHH